MKKFLTLVLALALALGLTVPAMAFTSDTTEADESIPYELSIYLVEYDDNDFFGMATLPESDRGYAKNEIVAAIVELYVPKNEDPFDDNYSTLDISGDNVSFDVTDDYIAGTNAPALTAKTDAEDGFTYTLVDNALAGKNTFKWLVFAKVTDDEASLSAELVDGTAADEFSANSLTLTLEGVTYTVTKAKASADVAGTYTVSGDGETFVIDVDKNYKSTGMSINGEALGVNTKGELGIVNGAVIDTDSEDFEDTMDVYEDVVVDVFGLDYFNIGNYVRDSFFEGLVSADTITATVDIEPWTAYVVVPDNIVVDPPKTGDAASIVGFVMVALAGGSAVALKKRG